MQIISAPKFIKVESGKDAVDAYLSSFVTVKL